MNKVTYGNGSSGIRLFALRTVTRVDIPIDASPVLAEKMLRVNTCH